MHEEKRLRIIRALADKGIYNVIGLIEHENGDVEAEVQYQAQGYWMIQKILIKEEAKDVAREHIQQALLREIHNTRNYQSNVGTESMASRSSQWDSRRNRKSKYN